MDSNNIGPVNCSIHNFQRDYMLVEEPGENQANPIAISTLGKRRNRESNDFVDENSNKRRRITHYNIQNEICQGDSPEVPEENHNHGIDNSLIRNSAPLTMRNRSLKRRGGPLEQPLPVRRRNISGNDAVNQQPCSSRVLQKESFSSKTSSRASSPPVLERDPFLRDRLSLEDRASKVSSTQSKEFDRKFTVSGKDIDFKHSSSEKMALFIYPKNDHNNAFRLTDHLKYRLLALSKHYSVKVRYVGGVDEAADLIKASKDGETHHLVLGGHGTASSITFGYGGGRAKLTKQTKIEPKIFEKLAPRATILLDSCSAGLGLAEYISQLAPGRHVYGSEVTLYSSMILIDSIFPYRCTIAEQGRDRTAISVC